MLAYLGEALDFEAVMARADAASPGAGANFEAAEEAPLLGAPIEGEGVEVVVDAGC